MRRPHQLLASILCTGVAAAALVGLGAPGGAQQPLALDDVGEGTCTPDPVHPGSTTDCSFALERPAPLDPDGGPYRLEVARASEQELPHCRVEDDRLRCPDLPVRHPGPEGDQTQAATLAFGEQHREEAVVVGVTEPSRTVRLRIADTTLVTPNVPLRYATANLDQVEGAWLQVTRRYDDEVLTTVELDDTGGWDTDPAAVPADELGLEAGSYRLHLCIGDAAATCEATGRSNALQVVDAPLEPLLDDQADPTADRINLVVAGHGFADHEAFTDVAATALGPDGLVLSDEDGTRLDREEAEQVAQAGERVDLRLGLFAIEPFDEHRDRFNLWVLPDQLDDPRSLYHSPRGNNSPPWVDGLAVDGHELENVSVATLAQDPPGADPGSRAASNRLHEVEGPIERGGEGEVGFSGSTTWVDAESPWRDVTTVAHELGHALFGLRDEYRDPSSSFPNYGYPNCAESRDQAEQWWGDRVGELDPMAERYRELVETFQPELRDISDAMLAEWVGIDIHEHPCGAGPDAPASFVPTERGLMANQLPVLGSVNRARVEQVLGLFSGQPATDEDAPQPTDGETGNETEPTPTRTAEATTEATPTEAVTTPGGAGRDGRAWLAALLGAAGVAVAAAATWAWRRRDGPPRGA